jgi:ferredoxin
VNAKRLAPERLHEWIGSLMQKGWRVVGPVRSGGMTLFSTITAPEQLALGPELPRKSPKGVFFPQSEVILRYRQKGGQVEVEDVGDFSSPTVLIGVHPCDAASSGILDKIFTSRYPDKFYLERREKTVIVSLGCAKQIDDSCFCTAVGLGPDSRVGADIFTMRDADGGLYMEILSEKGAKLFEGAESLLEEVPETVMNARQPAARDPEEKLPFELDAVKSWLDEHFDDEFWKELALRCAGCGTCAYLCPVCHCFDICDETRLGEGVRRKNWDSCQFGLFTKHASGHNPRHDQSDRFRQRVMHKFKYYQDNFGSTLCVGCGRCVRSCPVGQSLLEVLVEIGQEAKATSGTQGAV